MKIKSYITAALATVFSVHFITAQSESENFSMLSALAVIIPALLLAPFMVLYNFNNQWLFFTIFAWTLIIMVESLVVAKVGSISKANFYKFSLQRVLPSTVFSYVVAFMVPKFITSFIFGGKNLELQLAFSFLMVMCLKMVTQYFLLHFFAKDFNRKVLKKAVLFSTLVSYICLVVIMFAYIAIGKKFGLGFEKCKSCNTQEPDQEMMIEEMEENQE